MDKWFQEQSSSKRAEKETWILLAAAPSPYEVRHETPAAESSGASE